MAGINLTGFGDLERTLKKLAKPEKMAIKAVDAAAPVLEKSLKREVDAATTRRDKNGKPYSTGELSKSIGRTKAKENEMGVFAAVLPMGTDSRGMRNAEKLAYLEYGVKSHGQEPRPVRQKAVNSAKDECIKVMEEVVSSEVDKL